jgi:hypothetical protein
MKKLYTLLLLVVVSMSFGQTFYSENVGTATGTIAIATNVFQNGSPIAYSGDADTRSSTPSSTYPGFSAGRNVFFAAAGAKFFQISGLNTSGYTSANILMSFGYLTTTTTAQMVVEYSTDGSTWNPISFTNNTTTAWTLVSIPGGILPSSATLSLRFTAPATGSGMRIDDIALTNFNPACTLVLGTPVTACDVVTFGIDTYTTTIPYTGGGVGPYTITPSTGTVGGDNPNSVAAGNIVISNITEGTNISVSITKGVCTFSANATAPECKPVNGLPFSETFPYTAASSLGSSQKWTNINTGPDSIVSTAGSLTYPGFTTAGNSVTFGADGIDSFTPLASTATGTVYYSYLLNVNSMTGVTNVDGGYISGLAKGTNGLGATLWTKRVDDTNFNLGIEVRTANAANTTYTTTSYATGTTYFVVVGYTFGAAAADDTVSLWVNPTLGGAQPAATLTDAQAATATDLTDIDYFFLRQDSTTETPALQIDELRVATTWAQVTSSVLSVDQNAISGLKIYPNPVSRGTLYVETTANAEKIVTLYDVLGKQVLNTTTSTNEVNVSNLHSGLYIVKITEEGKTATRKLVIE